MTRKQQTKPPNFWDRLKGRLKSNPDTRERVTESSIGIGGTELHIGAVYGGIGGSGGSGASGGTGGTGQGPNFSAGVMHINSSMYGASRPYDATALVCSKSFV
ncbi:hypothetical protein MSAN_00288300 [Mycena sanguinolenta]|uniref:Uncharacterized protein n=1 Tax=Mycena sanguinolenta TaxID=230812 RepID=A0A8H6ZBA3_9AGAR|nr:hypothetical protein MSAN_00288300 [Mycena sanguinolenta]